MATTVIKVALVLTLALIFLTVGCQAKETKAPSSTKNPDIEITQDQTITLGDVDSDEPLKKVKRFQPLADYLAEHLGGNGIKQGKVVIARDIEEMARYLKDGTVDVYFDSAYPTLLAQQLSGSDVILRRWKDGIGNYWSTYVVLQGSGVGSVEGFLGKVIAFEEPRSTSGFVLPAGTLFQRGYSLIKVAGPEADVDPNEIGYFFSRHQDNTFELVLDGRVSGGGISNQDYDELEPDLKEKLTSIDETIPVPRQLVSVRPGLDPELVTQVRELLMGLNQTEEGQELLIGLKNTMKFDPLPPEANSSLGQLRQYMSLVVGE